MRHVQTIGWLLFVVLVGTIAPSRAWAQQTTDRFAWYVIPGECATQAQRLETRFWRDQRPDTTIRAPWGNPLQRSTVAGVRQCIAKFRIESVAERDLVFLGRAYLAAEQDVQADSAFRRLMAVSASRPVEERAWLLLQIVAAHLQASPIRVAGAIRYTAELDKLGVPAAASRMMAHTALAQAAAAADSIPMLGEQAKAAVAAGKQMVGDERKQRANDELGARKVLADWYARRAVFDSARIVAKGIETDLSGQIFRVDDITKAYTWMGSKAQPLERTHSFNNPDSAQFPAAGKPTLVVFASTWCQDDCFQGYSVMRRLAEKYAASGFRIVITTQTWGYFGDHLLKPKEEVEKIRWYFLDYLKLPATVDVRVATFKMRDDGVRENDTPAGVKSYYPVFVFDHDPKVILVDRAGNVRMGGPLNAGTERRYDHLLAEMK